MYGLSFKIKKLLYKRNQRYKRKHPPTLTEQFITNICKELLRHKDSESFVSPASGDRYIRNKIKHIDISIKASMVEICNGSFQYIVSTKHYVLNDIIAYQNRVLESKKRLLEKNRGRNINDSLSKILNEMKN